MDEPTNHLDIISKGVLKLALKKFQGTLILVSHDRDFLDELCEIILEFKDQKVKTHLGGVKSFLDDKKIQNFSEIKRIESKEKKLNTNNQFDYSNQKKVKKIKDRIKKLESKIGMLEKKLKAIDLELEIKLLGFCSNELEGIA